MDIESRDIGKRQQIQNPSTLKNETSNSSYGAGFRKSFLSTRL